MEAIIVTGMSGAGKSCAYECFEDLGYYCIDNLPPVLIGNVIELLEQGGKEVAQAVFVIDIRGGDFFHDMKKALSRLEEKGIKRKIIFLDASDDVLLRRFNETRRSHPLASQSNLEGIEKERRRLLDAKRMSDLVIDTSAMKAAALKEELKKLFLQENQDVFKVNVMSFGFKYGIPQEADLVFDMRFIPNPFYVPQLKELTGNNKKVRDYVMASELSAFFRDRAIELVKSLIPGYIKEGKYQLNLAFGCTGGRHRSVTMAIIFQELLAEEGHRATLTHRDI